MKSLNSLTDINRKALTHLIISKGWTHPALVRERYFILSDLVMFRCKYNPDWVRYICEIKCEVWRRESASGIFVFCLMCCCLHPQSAVMSSIWQRRSTEINYTQSGLLWTSGCTELLWGLFKTRNHDRPPLHLTAGGDNVLKTSHYCRDGKMVAGTLGPSEIW